MKIACWLTGGYLLYALLLGLLVPAVARSVLPEKLTQLLGRQVTLQQLHINPFLLRLQLDGVAIAGKGDSPQLSLTHADTQFNLWQSLFQQAWCINHLTLNGLDITLTRQADANGNIGFDIDDILSRLQSPATAPEPEPTAAPLADVRLGNLTLSQSNVQFTDSTSNTQLHYRDIALNLANFASHAQADNKQTAEMQVNHYQLSFTGKDNGTFTSEGQLLLAPLQVDGDLQLDNITLAPFWGYVQPLLQAQLHEGKINFQSHFVLTQPSQQPLNYMLDNGQLTLHQLQFTDGKTPVLTLPKLALESITLNGAQQRLAVQTLSLDGLWLNSRFDKQGLALAQLFTPKDAHDNAGNTDNASAENPPKASWHVALTQLQLHNADINLLEQQLTSGVNWRIHPLSITTGAIDSELSAPLDYQLSLAISSPATGAADNPRGHISSQGSIDLNAKQAQGQLTLDSLQLAQFQPYLQQYLNIELPEGQLSTGGEFTANAAGQARYQGDLRVAGLEIKDKKLHQPLLKWQQLAIDSVTFDAEKRQLLIGHVMLEQPYAKVTINEDRSTNIGQLLIASDAPATTKTPLPTDHQTQAATAAAPFQVSVASVVLNHGSAFFADNSLIPNFATGIEQLQGKISSLSSVPGTKASVDISGKIDRYAPMSLKGEINPLLTQPYLDLDLLFKSVELTSVNPYSGTYAGYYIDKGQLTLSLNYLLENNQLKGNNHVVIDQLQLGKPTESELATSLPVTLAIALLQDRHGVIDLGLPVSGDLDNPDFSFGGIILTALTNVITKAVTAPFSFLASLLDSDEELNLVAFEAGSATLSAAEQEKLKKLANALNERPKLTLSIQASVAPQQDSHVLAEQRLQQQLLQQSGLESLPESFSASRIPATGKLTDALLTLYQQHFQQAPDTQKALAEKAATDDKGQVDQQKLLTLWHIGLYNQLLNAQEITDADLGNLAQHRSQAVKAFLVEAAAVAPERVFLLDSKTKLDKHEAQAQLTLDAHG
ncbi:DUF748 domain-containing protein [Shewanella sp. YIC-542]|uniref:DUF748 domain-containing protein n=1 Tax=Shewanella mytili TaxID=3377111 RepID=UPI00398F843F